MALANECPEMNPLLWRREQQIALVLAAATGAAIGLVYGVISASPIFGIHDCQTLIAWLLHEVSTPERRCIGGPE